MTGVGAETVDSTRAALDNAARRLFAEHGYADTRVTAITRKAGVALSTFYAKYGSKEQAWLTTMGTPPPDGTVDGPTPSGRAARTRAVRPVKAIPLGLMPGCLMQPTHIQQRPTDEASNQSTLAPTRSVGAGLRPARAARTCAVRP